MRWRTPKCSARCLPTHAGHAVALKSSVRGERARFLEMAERNAAAALTSRLASRQTMLARFEDLANLLELRRIAAAHRVLRHQPYAWARRRWHRASCSVPRGRRNRTTAASISPASRPGDDYAAMHQALDPTLPQAGRGRCAAGCPADRRWQRAGGAGAGRAARARRRRHRRGRRGQGPGRGAPARKRWCWPIAAAPCTRGRRRRRCTWSRRCATKRIASPSAGIVAVARRRASAARSKTSPASVRAGVRALLKAFGGLAGVEAAGVEELMTRKGD